MIEGLEQWFCFCVSFRSPTCTFTRRTKPSVPSVVSTTRPSCHWFLGSVSSLMMTISFTFKLRRGTCHFCLVDVFRMYSFFHRLQNCSVKYCTLRHLFAAYISSFTNFPGGGKATLDFIRIRWFGVRGSGAMGSLIPSTFNGRLLMMAIAL